VSLVLRGFYYEVRIICSSGVKRSSVRPSVRLSVCPVDRQQQRRPAGLLLRSDAGSRYRPIAAATARPAGRVNVGLIVRESNILVWSYTCKQFCCLATVAMVTGARWDRRRSTTVGCCRCQSLFYTISSSLLLSYESSAKNDPEVFTTVGLLCPVCVSFRCNLNGAKFVLKTVNNLSRVV